MKSLKMKLACVMGALCCSGSWAASPQVIEQPIDAAQPVKVGLSKQLLSKGRKLRIKNLTTGKQVIVDLADQQIVDVPADQLIGRDSKLIVPEISILFSKKKAGVVSEAPSGDDFGGYRMHQGLITDSSAWQTLGFRSRPLAGGGKMLVLAVGLKTVIISAEDAARRRELKEAMAIKRKFDEAWNHLNNKRNDLALEAFNGVLRERVGLKKEQIFQAHLGRGMAKFHQLGCKEAAEDFSVADQDARNYDDVSYFRALCFVEAERWDDAKALFAELVRKQNQKYSEQSRFYLAVIAENKEEFDEAEGIYLDTIDFASDAQLVKLAKQRLDVVRQLKAEARFDNKWINFFASLGAGYDSNVVSLPTGSAPSDFNVTNEASQSTMGLAGFSANFSWAKSLQQSFGYSYLLLHYANASVAPNYDLQVHSGDFGLSLMTSDVSTWTLSGSYVSVFLGSIGTSDEFLATAGGTLSWSKRNGPLDKPTSQVDHKISYSRNGPRRAAALPTQDLTANSFVYGGKYRLLSAAPNVFGYGGDLEYRPATGSENSYVATTILGLWDRPIGPESWGFKLSQEGAFVNTLYFESDSKRKDNAFKYTASVGRAFYGWLDTKLQLIGTVNLSNVATSKYNKAQANLIVSAFF
jgi:hypothetical protein